MTERTPPKDPTQDPQDKQFGAAAARDQELADQLAETDIDGADLPDEPMRHPRAAGKARPEGEET